MILKVILTGLKIFAIITIGLFVAGAIGHTINKIRDWYYKKQLKKERCERK